SVLARAGRAVFASAMRQVFPAGPADQPPMLSDIACTFESARAGSEVPGAKIATRRMRASLAQGPRGAQRQIRVPCAKETRINMAVGPPAKIHTGRDPGGHGRIAPKRTLLYRL